MQTGISEAEMAVPLEPLVWPAHYPPNTFWKRFFLGVRGLGPDLSFFAALRRQQSSRTEVVMTRWGERGSRREVALFLGDVFRRNLGWPTPFFLPEDRVEVIANGPALREIDDFGPVQVVEAIERRLGRELGDNFWEHSGKLSLGELVDILAPSFENGA